MATGREGNPSRACVYRRTLPLRLSRAGDEGVDSWVAAQARRHDVSFADLVECFALATRHGLSWWLWLPQQAQQYVAEVSGLAPDDLRAMTFHRYLDETVAGGDVGEWKSALWIRSSGSRFCPDCLRDNEGRWRLPWRLNWHFACLEHRRLLIQECPRCHRPQRCGLPPARHVPVPGVQCHSGYAAHVACTEDLSGYPGETLPQDSPILLAQRRIDDLLRGRESELMLYGPAQCSASMALRDLKVLARWSGACVDLRAIDSQLPAGLTARIAELRNAMSWPYGPYWSNSRADFTVDETVFGAIIGLKIITAERFSTAHEYLHLLTRTATPSAAFRDGLPTRHALSSRLRAVNNAACEPVLAGKQIIRMFECSAAKSARRSSAPTRQVR